MRWALGIISIGFLALVLSLSFAWQRSHIEPGWDADRLVVDASRVHSGEQNVSHLVAPFWMDRLSDALAQPKHPADEMFISWDLVTPEFRQSMVLALVLEGLNRFDKRCLKHFLTEHQVEHEWVEGEPIWVRLVSKEPEYAQGLIDKLATFDLPARLHILQETKPY